MRSPTTEIPDEDVVEIRSTPRNGSGKLCPAKIFVRKFATCPRPCSVAVTGVGNPDVDPSELKSSKVMMIADDPLFVTAMSVCMLSRSNGIPDDLVYMWNVIPQSVGNHASDLIFVI